MRELIPTEEQEMMVLCEWLKLNHITFCHPFNEGHHNVAYRRKQALLGLAKGIPDILIFDVPGVLHTDHGVTVLKDAPLCTISGVAIELKRRKGGKASPEQKQWLADLERRGWLVRICKGADEAIGWLVSLGIGRRSA